MVEIRYKIPILSVRALTAYAKEQSDEVYSYNLTKNETESVIQRGSETYQNENAIFYQAMQQITNKYKGKIFFTVYRCGYGQSVRSYCRTPRRCRLRRRYDKDNS